MSRTALADVHYRQVAEVWREAAAETDETSLAVAQTWGVPLSTANGWIKRARARGLLEERQPRCSGRCGKCCRRFKEESDDVPNG